MTVAIVKCVAQLPGEKFITVFEQEHDRSTLGCVSSPDQPLSKALLDGAGLEYRPLAIAVYINGVKKWSRRCRKVGATDAFSSTHPMGKAIKPIPFSSVEDDLGYHSPKLAAARAAWETMRNDHSARDDAEEWAEQVIAEAGSLRPKLQPEHVEDYSPVRPNGEHVPRTYVCDRYGTTDGVEKDLAYQTIRQCRHTPAGTEMLVGHEFQTV